MKEATGTLGSAVIVAVCVATLVAFFYFTIWPIMRNNFNSQTACDKAVCLSDVDANGMVSCKYKGDTFKCRYKG